MPEEKVGKVVKFFAKPSVAAIEVTDGVLSVGDKIKIKGHTTDFEDTIASIKVKDRVREHDVVYKITD